MDRPRISLVMLLFLVLSALIAAQAVKASVSFPRAAARNTWPIAAVDGAAGDDEQQSSTRDHLSSQSFLDDFASQQAGRSLLTGAEDSAYDVVLQPDATWSNASFASWLCGNLTATASLKVSPTSSLLLLLPPCFYDSSVHITTLSLARILLIGNSETHSDPLIRLGLALGSSLKDLSLDSCTLVTASGAFYTADNWQNVFVSMPSITSFKLTASGLTGALPGSIPARVTLFALSGNALSGSIPSTLLANFESTATTLVLDLSGNRLEGAIPPTLFDSLRFDSITTFSVSLANNGLSGTIPSKTWLSSFSAATSFSLDLSSNGLIGDLAFFNELNFSSLSSFTLNVASNSLTGTLPSNLITIATDGRSSMMPLTIIINLSGNKLSGTIPGALFWAELSLTQSLLVDLSNNALEGSLPSALLNYVSAPLLSTLQVKFSGNAKIGGSIPAAFFDSLNPVSYSPSDTSTARADVMIYVDGTGLTGALYIPDFSERLALGPLRLMVYAYGSKFTSLEFHSNASLALHYLQISSSTLLTGTLPTSLFSSSSVLNSLLASNTGLSGSMPNMGTLSAPKLRNMDLSGTAIDFCAGTRVAWDTDALTNCQLTSTSAYTCPMMYPRACTITPPPLAIVPRHSSIPTCTESTRPSLDFDCKDGHWILSEDYNETMLTLPSDAGEIIVGNISSTNIFFQGLGTTLILTGCAPNLDTVTLELDQDELSTIHDDTATFNLIDLLPGLACSNFTDVRIRYTESGSGCKKGSARKASSDGRLSTVISVEHKNCRTWWIILVSVLSAVVVILLVVFVVIVLCYRPGRKPKESYSKHKASEGTASEP